MIDRSHGYELLTEFGSHRHQVPSSFPGGGFLRQAFADPSLRSGQGSPGQALLASISKCYNDYNTWFLPGCDQGQHSPNLDAGPFVCLDRPNSAQCYH
jgi:hypothetical protein